MRRAAQGAGRFEALRALRALRVLGLAGAVAAAVSMSACASKASRPVTAPVPPGAASGEGEAGAASGEGAAGEAGEANAQAAPTSGPRQRPWTRVSRGSSAELESNEGSASTALARCCAALRQYGEAGPAGDRATYSSAAASCNGLRHVQGVPSTALWEQLRGMLSGVAVPEACR